MQKRYLFFMLLSAFFPISIIKPMGSVDFSNIVNSAPLSNFDKSYNFDENDAKTRKQKKRKKDPLQLKSSITKSRKLENDKSAVMMLMFLQDESFKGFVANKLNESLDSNVARQHGENDLEFVNITGDRSYISCTLCNHKANLKYFRDLRTKHADPHVVSKHYICLDEEHYQLYGTEDYPHKTSASAQNCYTKLIEKINQYGKMHMAHNASKRGMLNSLQFFRVFRGQLN